MYPWEWEEKLDIYCIRMDAELEAVYGDEDYYDGEDPALEEEETLTEVAIRGYHEQGGY